jgi:membrane-associated phospholipid phosphatase
MEGMWEWGLELIRAVQSVHGPALDAIFRAITFMGEEDFFLILLPLILWCVDFAFGARLAFFFLFSTFVNSGAKGLFAHPRPFDLDPAVKLHDAGGYGFPSGHSQSAVVVWGIIASYVRKRWAWALAVLLMVLIGFSRIYLGVHFPTDVLGGWALGAVFLAGYILLVPRIEAWLKGTGLAVRLALVVAIPLALVLLYPSDESLSALGVFMGAGGGIVLAGEWVPFSATGPLWQRAVRLLLGAAVVLGLRFGLKAVFPDEGEALYALMRFVRYALVGLWAGLGAPWLFVKLRLSSRKTESKQREQAESQQGERAKSETKRGDGSQDPYEILGVKPGSPMSEISAAYRKLAQENHPDKVAGLAQEFRDLAERRMKAIDAAYKELKRRHG